MGFVRTDFGQRDANNNTALPREWVYTTIDTAATVDSAGYFDDASDLVAVGDLIHAKVDTDGTPGFGTFAVSSNTGGVVDVNDLANLVGGTDSD